MFLTKKRLLILLLVIVSSLCLFLTWKLYTINNKSIDIGVGTYTAVDERLGPFSLVIDYDMSVIIRRGGKSVLQGTLISDYDGFKMQTSSSNFIRLVTSGDTLLFPLELTFDDSSYHLVLQFHKFANIPYSQED